jgi:hypothetical protein
MTLAEKRKRDVSGMQFWQCTPAADTRRVLQAAIAAIIEVMPLEYRGSQPVCSQPVGSCAPPAENVPMTITGDSCLHGEGIDRVDGSSRGSKA